MFRLWAKFSPWLHSARLWPVNPLGCFHNVIKYSLLTARYGPRIVRPMFGEMIIHPVEGPWILRPVEGPWILRPAGGPGLQQPMCCHGYCGLVTKNRLLWPLEKHRKRTAVTTSKQNNKEINKQATNARLLRLLHILHPLGIKVRHQCKYREQSSILHTLAVKIGHQCKIYVPA